MNFKVQCFDARASNRKSKGLVMYYKYTVVAVRREAIEEGCYTVYGSPWSRKKLRPLEFMLKEIPGEYYFARRFKPVGKISITLPDDLENIDI